MNATLKSGLRYYLMFAYSYTWVRKFLQLWDAKSERAIPTHTLGANIKYVMKPMLMGEKLGIFGACLIMAPCMMPVYLVNDLNKVDIYMKGECSKDYGYTVPKHPIDYLFV